MRRLATNRRVFLAIGTAALLLAVAGFSTAAKNSQYYSRSNPVHFLNISSKMKVAQAPAALTANPLALVARFVTMQPEIRATRISKPTEPDVPSVGVTVSLQHRSPPAVLA